MYATNRLLTGLAPAAVRFENLAVPTSCLHWTPCGLWGGRGGTLGLACELHVDNYIDVVLSTCEFADRDPILMERNQNGLPGVRSLTEHTTAMSNWVVGKPILERGLKWAGRIGRSGVARATPRWPSGGAKSWSSFAIGVLGRARRRPTLSQFDVSRANSRHFVLVP